MNASQSTPHTVPASTQPSLNNIVPQVPALPESVRLDNGVELNAVPMPSTDIVGISLMFVGGQWVQEKRLQSNFALQLLKAGTQSLNAEELADRLDYYGASITADATLAYSFVRLTCLRRTLPEVLPLFCDLLREPAYEQPMLDNALEEGFLSWQVSEQKVAYVSKRIFYQHLLGKENPAAQFAEAKDYGNIDREDLLRYHRQRLSLANAVVYVTGKTDTELFTLLNEHLGKLPCGKAQLTELADADIRPEEGLRHEATLEVPSVQSGLRMGKVMPAATAEDYPALQLTSAILGGYFGSRLMKNIRERLGFTYGIGSTFYPIPHHSVFIIATETPQEHVERCIEEVKKDIADLQQRPVSEDELKNAQNFLLGRFCRMTEVSLNLDTLLMHQRAQGRSLADLLNDQHRILAMTPPDVMYCARQYLSTESLLSVVTHGKQPQ